MIAFRKYQCLKCGTLRSPCLGVCCSLRWWRACTRPRSSLRGAARIQRRGKYFYVLSFHHIIVQVMAGVPSYEASLGVDTRAEHPPLNKLVMQQPWDPQS